jgi:hypothetical protein
MSFTPVERETSGSRIAKKGERHDRSQDAYLKINQKQLPRPGFCRRSPGLQRVGGRDPKAIQAHIDELAKLEFWT